MPSTTFTVDAILFDMDGTLVDSFAGVEGAWQVFKQKYPNIDVTQILSVSHGIRTVDNLRNFCGITDEEELERESERFETAIVTSSTEDGKQGIVMLPGVKPVLDELLPGAKLPNARWAICTSATRKYASAAIAAAGVPLPDVFVAAEDVKNGKPNPEPYLLGASKLGVSPEKCVVFEDAPNGVKSGKAAGAKTIAFLTTHSREALEATQPDFLVKNMSAVSMKLLAKGIEVTVNSD